MNFLQNLWKKKWMRGLVISLFLILVFFVGLFTFLWSKLDLITFADEIDHLITDEPFDEYVADLGDLEISDTVPVIPDSAVSNSQNVMNILLIGTDERFSEFHYNARADSMILVSINTDLQTVRLVSFERAVGVPILEGEFEGQYDLLTHIFRWGGSELLVKTIEHCFKVDIDNYVRVNFSSVRNIVDTIGGIDMEMTGLEAGAVNDDVHDGVSVLHSGLNRLDGGEALSFARLRRIDSDWKRVERQRKVILAVVEELKGSNLIELNNLADVVLPMIQTDMTKLDIAELVLYAPSFLQSEFDQMTIPKEGTYGGMAIRTPGGAFAVDYEINNDLLYRFLYEGASSEELLAE